jgi:hypothetical protein
MSTAIEKMTWHIDPKRNWGLLIVSLWSLLNGIWTDIQLVSYHPSLTPFLFNLLPGVLLLVAWYFAGKYLKGRWIIIIIGILSALVSSSFATSLNMQAEGFISSITPTTDISLYRKVREKIGDSELTQHFPSSIPENAENVHFEYLPKFMQGGSHLQLRMRLPQTEISSLFTEFRSHGMCQ